MKSDLSPSATGEQPRIVLVWNGMLVDLDTHGIDPQYFEGEDPIHLAVTPMLRGRAAVNWMESQSTPSETATPYAYEYVDKEGVETFTFQPPDRLKDAHEYKCTPLYKAPVSATRGLIRDCAEPSISRADDKWEHFDHAYQQACNSSDPKDWQHAAMLAQQVRRATPSATLPVEKTTLEEIGNSAMRALKLPPPQRYSIVLANGVVTWITTVDGEWVQWDDVQRQYVNGGSNA